MFVLLDQACRGTMRRILIGIGLIVLASCKKTEATDKEHLIKAFHEAAQRLRLEEENVNRIINQIAKDCEAKGQTTQLNRFGDPVCVDKTQEKK
jgi:transcriptional regulator NrdR family protein